MKQNLIKGALSFLLVAILFLAMVPRGEFANGAYEDKRIAGADRYETAVAISKKGWVNGANTIVLARGDLFADALSGVPLAHKLNAPILLTRSDKLPAPTKKEIERLKTKNVVILGSPIAVSDSIEKTIKQMGIKVKRIAGKDRYETSVAISKELGATKEKAVIATGENFPDALSIAPYAAEKGYPILLTKPTSLPKVAKDFLKGYKSTLIVGGEPAVGKEVETSLPNPERIGGATRYQTAAKIIEEKYDTNNLIYISTGENFADALTGATLAAKQHTAVLIVGEQNIPVETERLIPGNQIKNLAVFGSPVAVSDNNISELLKLTDKFSNTTGVGVVSEKTKLLENTQKEVVKEAIKKAVFNAETGIAQLNLTAAEVGKYKKGDILIIPPDDTFPTGLMIKVSSISENGQVGVSQPTIDEVLPYFNIDPKETKLDSSNLIDLQLQEGVSMMEDGQQINNYAEWKGSAKNKIGALATTPSTIKPLTFSVSKKLYESSDEKTTVNLKGKLTIKEITADPNLEKNWVKLPTAFDFKFKSKQDFALTGEFEAKEEFATEDQSKEIDKGWFKASGVDREGRISLATLTYQIGTVPVYGLGNAGYKEVPIGVTLFITANTKGTANVTAEAGVTWSSDLNANAEWKDGDFTAKTNLDTSSLKVTADAQGESNASLGVGVEPSINILGVLPLLIQNDLTRTEGIKGSINADYSLYPDDKWNWNGCFDYTNELSFTSTLKARLKATADIGSVEREVEIAPYQKDLYKKEFFNESKNFCAHSGKIMGTVKDAVSKDPISGVMVNVYKGGEYLTSAKTKEDGSYEIELADGTYKFIFDKPLYSKLTYNNVEINENIVKYSPELKLIGSQYLGNGKVQGTVKNALNGQPVKDATINLRSGLNTTDGEIIKTIKSNDSGQYIINDLPAGIYTGEVVKTGFISTTFTIMSIGGKTSDSQDVNVSPVLNSQETRVVLKWNEIPRDIDSHLTGPSTGEDRFHIYYDTKEYLEDDTSIVQLDRDDTDSYGPETITIHKQKDGVYRYSVHDYSNRGDDNSYALSNSGATVEVYRGNNLIKTFNVPANRLGTLWTVFELRGDVIVPVNTMSNEGGSFNISSFRSRQSNDLNTIVNSLTEKK
ncbi:cell wall-binding repeat-containing protein [Priestia megaterium]|uniref:cell wall-binding repeat-containing protein n=1 Tax=Priestia megaterium TaxID=1404 RepID=UPI00249C3B90|nr:cell wall-binding repeat-containing protein [Priestia megaterium]MDI3090172.1 cell wall-binding repeat-containing protein [Priestia megaterium]